MSPRLLYRTVAIAEAVTWTLLIAGLVLKYATATTDLGVTIAGPIHGFVFLAYGATAVLVGVNQRWPLWLGGVALVAAVIPFATIPLERALERCAMLSGGWRRQPDDGRRDTFADRMLRLVLVRPVLSTAAVVIVVVLAFSALLAIGPPRLPS